MFRNDRGNMLILVSVFMALVAILILLACSFGGLIFVQNRLQASADEIALAGAKKLNELDRIGQMNNMVARSRQMLYQSRKNLDEADSVNSDYHNLAEMLYNEDKDSALKLESVDRKHLQELARDEALTAMTTKFNEIKNSYQMTLPWLKVGIPSLVTPKLGKIKDVKSNVIAMKLGEEVYNHDVAASYVDAASGLYKNDINARLPGAEGAVNFKLCSLPAPVQKTISPARATLEKSFLELTDDQISSAVKVELKLDIATYLGVAGSGTMDVFGTAAATGGADPQ